MYVKGVLLILGFFLCASSFQNSRLVKGDRDLVLRLCNATISFNECTDCVLSDPDGQSTNDIGVVNIAMGCATKGIIGVYQVAYAYRNNSTDEALKEHLSFCLDRFEDSRRYLYEVVTKLRSRDFEGTKTVIRNQVLAELNTCTAVAVIKGIQLPQILSNDLDKVNDNWNGIVIKMLDVLQ